jgi:hypothetical protein
MVEVVCAKPGWSSSPQIPHRLAGRFRSSRPCTLEVCGVGPTPLLKAANLASTPIQNHVWGDILRRQVTGELRMRF